MTSLWIVKACSTMYSRSISNMMFDFFRVQTVREEDLIDEAPGHLPVELNDDSIENVGHLKLPSNRIVPNCCAICLGEYSVDDLVVWSSNPKFQHAFHQDCVVGWLVKLQPDTPCPCCRQEFTDLEEARKERKITWSGDAFNLNSVGF